jgi:hypothetical protein
VLRARPWHLLLLQLRITYHGTASSTSSGSSTEAKLLGRCLAVPVRLSIQPTIQVKSLRFLQQGLPLRNGSRDDIILSTPQRLLLQSLRDSRDTVSAAGANNSSSSGAAGGSPLKRTTSHHVRNSSEGALPAPLLGAPIAPLVKKEPQPSAAAGSSSGEPSQPLRALSPVRQAGAGSSTTLAAAAATAAVAAGGSLAVASQPVLELVVRNASERYFRWALCGVVACTQHTSLQRPVAGVHESTQSVAALSSCVLLQDVAGLPAWQVVSRQGPVSSGCSGAWRHSKAGSCRP